MNATELVEAIDRYLEADRPALKLRATKYLETKVRAQLRRTWKAQKSAVLAKLAKSSTVFPPERARGMSEAAVRADELSNTIPDSVKNDPALLAVIETASSKAFDIGVSHVVTELGITGSFDISIPAASDWMRTWGAARVTAIDDVTRARLRRLLVEAVDNNWSYQQTAAEITRMFNGFSAASPLGHIRNRAELVSVTEIGDAYEYGGRTMADHLKSTGLALDKEWLTSSSDVCPTCSSGAAQGWVHDGTAFANGFDGPLAHPGCRCALARRVRPDVRR